MTEPPFPDRLRIGYRWYRVSLLDSLDADSMNAWGYHSGKHFAIRVERSRPSQMANTLLHEIMHAALCVGRFSEVKDPSEEYIVASTTNLLTQIFQDNAALRDWFAWAWAQED